MVENNAQNRLQSNGSDSDSNNDLKITGWTQINNDQDPFDVLMGLTTLAESAETYIKTFLDY